MYVYSMKGVSEWGRRGSKGREKQVIFGAVLQKETTETVFFVTNIPVGAGGRRFLERDSSEYVTK